MTIVEISIISIFCLAAFSLYVLIYNGKKDFTTFVLVPLILFVGIVSGYSLQVLKGTPIYNIPTGEVQVISINIEKPTIWVLVKGEGDSTPKFYGMPYTKETAENLQSIQAENQSSGKFVVVSTNKDNTESTEESINFVVTKNSDLPLKENNNPVR